MLLPACRGFVGRAFSPAAWGLRHRRVCGTMRASSPTDAGQGPAGVCGIPVGQSGNAPLRLRLAAHPPSGLRCPHRTARAEARLCSATAAPAPSRCIRRRRRSTPQPLAGEALGGLPPGRLPCKGSCRVSRLRGAVPCLANILPGRRGALRHRRGCGTMQASAPTKHRAKPCRVWRMFARAGEAGLPGRLKNQPHRAAHGAAGQNQFAREPPGRYTGAGGAVFAALTPRRPSP